MTSIKPVLHLHHAKTQVEIDAAVSGSAPPSDAGHSETGTDAPPPLHSTEPSTAEWIAANAAPTGGDDAAAAGTTPTSTRTRIADRYSAAARSATTDADRIGVLGELLKDPEITDEQRESLVERHADALTPEGRTDLEQFLAVASENDRYAREYRTTATADMTDDAKKQVFFRLLETPGMTDVQRVQLVESHAANLSADARAELERFFQLVSAAHVPTTPHEPKGDPPPPVDEPDHGAIDQANAQLATLQGDRDAAQQQLDSLTTRMNGLKAQIAEVQEGINQHNARNYASLVTKRGQLQAQLTSVARARGVAAGEVSSIDAQIAQLTAQIAAL